MIKSGGVKKQESTSVINKKQLIIVALLVCVAVFLSVGIIFTGAWFFDQSNGQDNVIFGKVQLGSQTVKINADKSLVPTNKITIDDVNYSAGSVDAWYRVSVQITGIADQEEVVYTYGQISAGQTIEIDDVQIPATLGDEYQNQSALLQVVVEVIQKEGIPVGEHTDIADANERLSAQAQDAFVYAGYEFIKLPAVDEVATLDKLKFTKNAAGTGYIVQAKDTSITGDVVIPAYYEGLPVTEIAASGFRYTSVDSVSIPNTVTTIGSFCFAQMPNIKSINLPDSVTSLGEYAIAQSVNLVSVRLSNSMTLIKKQTFVYNSGLKHVFIPSSIKELEQGVFGFCSSLESIIIPEGVEKMGDQIFYTCSALKDVYLADTINTMGDMTFAKCTSLKFVDMPDNLSSCAPATFMDCSSLTTVDFSCKLTALPQYTFQNATLDYLILPENIKQIPEVGFNYTTIKDYLILPNTITKIEQGSFYYTTINTELTLPGSISSIADYGFYYCNISKINLPQVNSCTLSTDCFYFTTLSGEFYLPNNYTLAGTSNGQFKATNISSFRVDPDNPKYMTIDGVLYARKSTDPTSSDFNVPAHLEALPPEMTEYTIPYTVTTIRRYEGEYGKLVNFYVESGPNGEPHPTFSCDDGVLYDATGKCLLLVPSGKKLTTYTVRDGVTNFGAMNDGSGLGYGGLGFMQTLEYLYLPTSVKKVEGCCLEFCINLKAVTVVGGTPTDGVFDFSGLTNLTSIGYKALYQCEKMTTLKLGANLSYLGDGFAEMATALTTIYCARSTPPTIATGGYTDNVVANNFANMTIANVYIPSGSLSAYKEKEGWKDLHLVEQ